MKAALSTPRRSAQIDDLERSQYACVVIGGGITGAGVAREAALRGLRVALLEAEDFASGTSSRSSKLIHGGLRYLAMGDVALVKESALERKEVHRLAPHLAEPRWMVIPSKGRARTVAMRMAVSSYERLGEVAKSDLHQNWGRQEIEAHEPALGPDHARFACVYREYVTDDARLVLANLRDAVHHGAVALNHARVEGIRVEGGRACGVDAVCTETGRRFHVRAHAVINAAGPWVEGVRRLEMPDAEPLLHLSKGVHIVVKASKLPVRNLWMLRTQDKRYIFAVRRGDVVYIGTTDTSFSRHPEVWPGVRVEEVKYLLDAVNEYCRPIELDVSDCVASWAGLRPLVAEPGKKPGDISRKDEVYVGPAQVVTIAGGKLTGYRMMARRALVQAAEVIGMELPPAPSAEDQLPGGNFDDLEALVGELRRAFDLSQERAGRLARNYGTEAHDVLALGARPVVPDGKVVEGEVRWAVEHEAAATLEDLLYRRTGAALYLPEERDRLLEPLADLMASELHWDGARRDREVQSVQERIADDLSFRT